MASSTVAGTTRRDVFARRSGLETTTGTRTSTLDARSASETSTGTRTGARTSADPREWLPAVDELVHYRHDRAVFGVVESAVRAAGGFPTQGGGTRVAALPSRAPATMEGPA